MTTSPMPPGGSPTAYGPPPAQLPAARPPSRAMAWAVAAASIVVGLGYVANAVAAVVLQGPLTEADRAQDNERLAGIYLVIAIVAVVVVVAWVVAFVLTGVWLLQLRRFAERVNPHFQHGRRRWWAFGGWVVPIVNLWFPLQYTGNLRDSLRPHEVKTSLFGWWWAASLVSAVAERSATIDEEGLDLMAGTASVQAGLTLLALVLWLAVVRNLATAVDRVPEDVVRRTALEADPSAYDRDVAPPGAPIYGPPHG